jgi:excisionase family DNA binding protein
MYHHEEGTMIAMQEDTLLSLNEAAQKLGVSRNTARKFIEQKTLQAIRVGRQIKVRQSAIDRYFRENRTDK